MRSPSRSVLAPLYLVALLAAACSSSAPPVDPQEARAGGALQEVGTMLHQYGGEFRRGPAKPAADLARYKQLFSLGYEAVKSGEVVVVPGATMPDEGGGNATDAVVAYEKAAPTQGGYVLLHNGTVKKMTPEEFKGAKRFGG